MPEASVETAEGSGKFMSKAQDRWGTVDLGAVSQSEAFKGKAVFFMLGGGPE
jgi:hypothetical protein